MTDKKAAKKTDRRLWNSACRSGIVARVWNSFTEKELEELPESEIAVRSVEMLVKENKRLVGELVNLKSKIDSILEGA